MTNISYLTLLSLFVSSLFAFGAVHWIYFKVLKIAKQKNLVDNPDARKLQANPVPVLGGIAVFFGVIIGIFTGCMFNSLTNNYVLSPVYPVLAAMVIMLYVGATDDILGLSPKTRVIIEVFTLLTIIFSVNACIDSLHDLWGIGSFSWYIAVPLTVFAGVGIINAINMIDGVNGLSSSMCIVCNLGFGIAFARSGDYSNAVINFSMASALIPFLIHNLIGRSSKMFIGDAGTMMMGILMSWDVIEILRSDTSAIWMIYNEMEGMSLVALTLAILSVPVFDTLRVMTMRIIHKRSPFSPDRTHLHHVLMDYTQSHTLTTLYEVAAAVLIILNWSISYMSGASINVQFYVVLVSAIFYVWGSYFFLTSNMLVHTGIPYTIRKYFAKSRQGDKDWWLNLQRKVDSGEE